MAEPKLLILDEPSLGLSPLLVEELFALIKTHQRARASRSCWSSRTWCRAWRSRAAPMCSTTADCAAGKRRRLRNDPNLKRPIWECDDDDEKPCAPACLAQARSWSRPASTTRSPRSLADAGGLRDALRLRRGHRLYAARPARHRPRLHDEVAETLALIRERVARPSHRRCRHRLRQRAQCRSAPCALFERAGATAIQLEDQDFPKRCGHLDDKGLIPAGEMVGKIKAARRRPRARARR